MGAQLRVYRQRIRSAETTKKITRAMELISASRITRALEAVQRSDPYARAVTRAVSAVAAHSNSDHPLLTEPTAVRRSAIVVFTSDRGLAGAFNSQIIRETGELREQLQSAGKEVVYYLIGRKAVQYFQFRGRDFREQWTGATEKPEFSLAKEISETLVSAFRADYEDGGVDEIHLVYNRFYSRVSQKPETLRLLPLEVVEGEEGEQSVTGAGVDQVAKNEPMPLYEFEPDAESVLDAVLPIYIESRIFNALLQSAVSKHAATQSAMKSATDNADKLITDYTRLANNARQAEITQQIAEIVGGADALSVAK